MTGAPKWVMIFALALSAPLTSFAAEYYALERDGWGVEFDGIRFTARGGFWDRHRQDRMSIAFRCENDYYSFIVAGNSNLSSAPMPAKLAVRARDAEVIVAARFISSAVAASSPSLTKSDFLKLIRTLYDSGIASIH